MKFLSKILIVIVIAVTTVQSQVVKTVSSEAVGYRSFVATAYCLKGKTASGAYVSQGTIAVDRRLIPLGTKIEILGLGTYIARDTGGDIKGNRLDLWFPSCSQALKFGKRTVKVKIIPKQVKKI